MTMLDDRPPSPPSDSPAEPRPLRLRLIGACLVAVAVLVDLALQTRSSGVAASLAVVVLSAGLVVAGPVRRPVGRALLVVAVGCSVFLAVRSSPWLIFIDVVTVAVVISLAVTSSAGHRAGDTRFAVAGRRMVSTVHSFLVALPLAVGSLLSLFPRSTGGAGRRLGALARGLLLALPVVLVVGVLLASADPVFASLFSVDVDLSGLPLHLIVVALVTWMAAGYFVAAARPAVSERPAPFRIGATEGLVVVTALTALYGVFAASRYAAATRGADYILETSGMTYAEYARSGFFQLLWVAGLTAAVLVVLRGTVELRTPTTRRLFAGVSCIACVLTLVVVHAAIAGLAMYEDTFGLTLLRFYSSAFAWWLGAAFVLMAAAFAMGTTSVREWLPTAVGISAIAAVVAVNVVNPDALVVERNVERHVDGASFDTEYAATLSSDAVPSLIESLPDLGEDERDDLELRLCRPDELPPPRTWDEWGAPSLAPRDDGNVAVTSPNDWNLSIRRATSALNDAC